MKSHVEFTLPILERLRPISGVDEIEDWLKKFTSSRKKKTIRVVVARNT